MLKQTQEGEQEEYLGEIDLRVSRAESELLRDRGSITRLSFNNSARPEVLEMQSSVNKNEDSTTHLRVSRILNNSTQ